MDGFMGTHHDKGYNLGLTLVEAVEALSSIADLETEATAEAVLEQPAIMAEERPLVRDIHWLQQNDADTSVKIVKDIFKLVLNYLRNFSEQDYNRKEDPQSLEKIKAIMVLVGEAAKKLDKHTTLFHFTKSKSVTELKEYKRLQEFYISRIARKIDQGILGQWILAISQKIEIEKEITKGLKLIGTKSSQTKHVFVDLDSVKRDTEYELFYLRKEDGSRFFSPRLIRNIKLVSDFGGYFGEDSREDPLLNLEIWQDRQACASARNILRAASGQINRFYHEAMGAKGHEIVLQVNKMLIALMLAGNQHNMIHQPHLKSCKDYLHDFQYFLRTTLHLRDYQRMIAYPPAKSNQLAHCLLDTIHTLCMTLYTQDSLRELMPMVHALMEHAHERRAHRGIAVVDTLEDLPNSLLGDYGEISKLLKMHPNGPLNKILNVLEEGQYHQYDPLFQANFPSLLYTLYNQDSKCSFVRLPSPTSQEFINNVVVSDEFKGFIRACMHERHSCKCLIFNMQDRLTWKEHFRCTAIEELARNESFQEHISVVTLAKDTEFYHQMPPYEQENHANIFLDQLKEQVFEDNCGFLFSEAIDQHVLRAFSDECIKSIHRIFFSNKNVFTQEQKLNFIEIFYFFLQLKIIELSKPDIVGFTCKDSIDIGMSTATQLFTLFKLFTQEYLPENEREFIDLMLYGPVLLLRERVMMPDRFNRHIGVLKSVVAVRSALGKENFRKVINEAFGRLYKTPIFQSKIVLQ